MADVIDARSSGTEQAWAALGGDPALLDRIDGGGPAGLLPARLPVMELARSTRRGLRAGRAPNWPRAVQAAPPGRWSGSGSTTVRWPPRSSASGICGSTGGRRSTSPRCPGSGGRPTAGSAPTPTTRTTGPGCWPRSACPPMTRRGRRGRGARRAVGRGDRGDGVRRGRSGRRTAYPGGVGGARAGRRGRHTPAADARPDRGAGRRRVHAAFPPCRVRRCCPPPDSASST